MIQLETSRARYVQKIYNIMDKLYRVIRKGDLVWVEGRSEMSWIIKLLSLVFPENQISLKLRFIEIKVIEIYEIIAYTKLHATYRIFASYVKLKGQKMGILADNKDKFICLDSPHQPVIKIKYLRSLETCVIL